MSHGLLYLESLGPCLLTFSRVWHWLAVGHQPPEPPPHCQRNPRLSGLLHVLGGKALPQPHEKPFPRGVPTPGKAGRAPSAAPPRGWNTGRDQCGRRGVATLFQSGPGAFRWGPCPAPALVLPGAACDPQENCSHNTRATSCTGSAICIPPPLQPQFPQLSGP